MEKNIARAVKLYSGDKPLGLFVDRLDKHLARLNEAYEAMTDVFQSAGEPNLMHLPEDETACRKFAKLFKEFNEYLEAARVQGFIWEKREYFFQDEETQTQRIVQVIPDERQYLTLAQRYKELFSGTGTSPADSETEHPYEIVGYLTTIDTDKIDTDYMNSRFDKYLKALQGGEDAASVEAARGELHKTFATLSQEEQKAAELFLHDILRGDVVPDADKTLRDYITEYICKGKEAHIERCATLFGLDEHKLRELMNRHVTEANINEFGKFVALKETADMQKAKAYFDAKEGTRLIPPKVRIKLDALLRDFILKGGFEV